MDCDNKRRNYVFISENATLNGIYEKHDLPLQQNTQNHTVKVTYQEEAESILSHAQGLLASGYTFYETIGILNNRISGRDKKNPTFHVIFSKKYYGVFSSEEMKLIPSGEHFELNKKFYLKESAINYFKENEHRYAYGPYYLVNSDRIQGIFTDIEKLLSFIDSDTSIKEFNDLLSAENRLENYIKKQKKKAGYIVIFAKNFSGIFNAEEKSFIPKHEAIYYERRFKFEKEAIDDFCNNEFIYHDKAYYVIQSNRINGIFTGLDLVKPFTKGSMDVTIKKHHTLSEARKHFEQIKQQEKSAREVIAYVDGSYCSATELSGYAYLLVANRRIIYENKGTTVCDNGMKHMNGELEAVMNSILKAIDLGFKKVLIKYDADFILSWAKKESNRVRSSSSRMLSKKYREFITRMQDFIDIDFQKIKAHSHKYYNDRVDFLAKQAAGNRRLDVFFPKRNEYVYKNFIKQKH